MLRRAVVYEREADHVGEEAEGAGMVDAQLSVPGQRRVEVGAAAVGGDEQAAREPTASLGAGTPFDPA